MDWFLFITSLIVAGGTIWGMRFSSKRRYSEIGQVICWWYTGPAIFGIGIMGSYTIAGFYLYFTTFIPSYILFFWLGLVVIGFYYFFGRAAIGSLGVFSGGRCRGKQYTTTKWRRNGASVFVGNSGGENRLRRQATGVRHSLYLLLIVKRRRK